MIRRIALAAALWLAPIAALAANCTSNPFTLTNGQTADATQVMANFNNLLNCANNNLAHNGANSDITSLSGLTTPISVPQGGTGLATLTANGLIVGNGSSTPTFIVPSTLGNLLQSVTSGWISTNAWPNNLPTKTVPVTADLLPIGDSAAGNAAKTISINSLSSVVTPPNAVLVRAWGVVTQSGGSYTVTASNPAGASIAKNGTGLVTVTTGVTMGSTNYVAIIMPQDAGGTYEGVSQVVARTQTTVQFANFNGFAPGAQDWSTGFMYEIVGN